MEGFLLRLSRFLTEFLTLMVESPHLIKIFVSAKLRLNAKKNLLQRKIIITATMMIILILIMIIVITVKMLLLLLL